MAEIKGMEIIDINPQNWAEKHKLSIKTDNCTSCGKTLKLDTPCKSYGYVGFIKRGCDYCKSDMVKCYFKPSSNKKKGLWSLITKELLL